MWGMGIKSWPVCVQQEASRGTKSIKEHKKINKVQQKTVTTCICNLFETIHKTLPHLSRCRHAELPFQLFCAAKEEREICSRWEERNTSPLTIWLTAVSCAKKKSDPPQLHPQPWTPKLLPERACLCRTLLGLLCRTNWRGEQKGKIST